jgi:hypothetical protein
MFNRELAASASEDFEIAELYELEPVAKCSPLANHRGGRHWTEWQL